MTNPPVPPAPGPGPQPGPGSEPPPVMEPARPISAEEASRPLPTSAVKFTRTAAAWTALIVGLLILVILVIFIAQNTASTAIHFLGWQWDTPVAVAILVSAICGAGVTVLTGAARILQLRLAARKNLRAATVRPARPR